MAVKNLRLFLAIPVYVLMQKPARHILLHNVRLQLDENKLDFETFTWKERKRDTDYRHRRLNKRFLVSSTLTVVNQTRNDQFQPSGQSQPKGLQISR